MGKEKDEIWGEWEEAGPKKVFCRHCKGKPIDRHATRCKQHTAKCPSVPNHIKTRFFIEGEGGGSSKGVKRKCQSPNNYSIKVNKEDDDELKDEVDEWEGSDGVEGDFEIEPEQDNYSNQMEQMLSHLNEESVIKANYKGPQAQAVTPSCSSRLARKREEWEEEEHRERMKMMRTQREVEEEKLRQMKVEHDLRVKVYYSQIKRNLSESHKGGKPTINSS